MKLGLEIPYSGTHAALPMEKIRKAEELGFDAVWSAEAYGSDAFTPLAFIGAQTKRIRLCTGIAQIAARPPANCAMTAQTLDELAGKGRVVVGLGLSGPQIVEGWYGQPWGQPLERMRDYVAILRKIWKREGPVTHDGPEIALPYTGPGSSGLGKPLKSILHGNPDIPVMLGTATPGAVRLTGEIADGWLTMHSTPQSLSRSIKVLEQGIANRTDGKTLDDLEVVGNVRVIITDDVKAALDLARPTIALYVGGMGAQSKNYHKQAMIERGYAEAAERIQELFLAGRKEAAIAAVPDDFLEMSLVGPHARIAERFKAWRDSRFTHLRLVGVDSEAMELMARATGSI
jgi:F420-dependent oxidoreductase-like protein